MLFHKFNVKMAPSTDIEKFCEICKQGFNSEKAVGCEGKAQSGVMCSAVGCQQSNFKF